MCKDFSFILTKDNIYYHPLLSSHEDVIDYYQLNDTTNNNLLRIEIIPKDNNYFNHHLDNWRINIDQDIYPDWWKLNLYKDKLFEKLKAIFQEQFIVNNKLKLLTGGKYFVNNSTINNIKYCIITCLINSQVDVMRDNSKVDGMQENSQVNEIRDNSKVDVMWGNSKVNEIRDNSQVDVMWGNSKVDGIRDNSQVNVMRDNSQVNVMRDNSQVNVMRDNSQVNVMQDNSKVNVMWNNSQVNVMQDNSKILTDNRHK